MFIIHAQPNFQQSFGRWYLFYLPKMNCPVLEVHMEICFFISIYCGVAEI